MEGFKFQLNSRLGRSIKANTMSYEDYTYTQSHQYISMI